MTPEQIQIYRAMPPRDKLALIAQFNDSARDLKARGLRMLHPDWSEADIRKKVKELFLYAPS